MKPHTRVIYRVEDDKLVVEPIPSLEDVLKEPKNIKITVKEFYEFRKALSKRLEE